MVIFSALGFVPPPSRVLAMHEAQFEVVQPKPPPEAPPPDKPKEPEPPKEPPKVAARPAAPKPAAAPPPQEAAPPAPADEPTDFTGVTLTAEGGSSSWTTAVGSGAALTGPIGKIGKKPDALVAAKSGPVGPRLVALESLARKPAPPGNLNDLLKQYYPRRAQLQGVEGRVVVRVRILPNGHVADVRVIEESPAAFEFASACRELLHQAPPWQPPLDGTGKAVATEVTFKCTFEVGY
jgi:protein TonB